MKILTIILALIISTLGPPFIGGIEVSASIILKILVVNPSQTESQTIPVNVNLPKEVNPKDIIDLGDLTLNYDAETGMYSVHAEVALGPGESVNKFVEMKDVWVHTEEQLSSFLNEAKEAAKQLEGTPYAEEGTAIVSEVQQKIEEILRRQEEAAENPGEHIRAYRQAISAIASVEQNISRLGQLKLEASVGKGLRKGPSVGKDEVNGASAEKDQRKGKDPSAKGSSSDSEGAESTIPVGAGADGPLEGGAPLGRSISMTTAWRIIFGILIFLGVLSAVFFMFWHRMVGVNAQKEQQGEPLQTEIHGDEGSESSVIGSQAG